MSVTCMFGKPTILYNLPHKSKICKQGERDSPVLVHRSCNLQIRWVLKVEWGKVGLGNTSRDEGGYPFTARASQCCIQAQSKMALEFQLPAWASQTRGKTLAAAAVAQKQSA